MPELPDFHDVGLRGEGLGMDGLSQLLQVLGFQFPEEGNPP